MANTEFGHCWGRLCRPFAVKRCDQSAKVYLGVGYAVEHFAKECDIEDSSLDEQLLIAPLFQTKNHLPMPLVGPNSPCSAAFDTSSTGYGCSKG